MNTKNRNSFKLQFGRSFVFGLVTIPFWSFFICSFVSQLLPLSLVCVCWLMLLFLKGQPRLAPQTLWSRFPAVYSKNKQDKTTGRPKSKATRRLLFLSFYSNFYRNSLQGWAPLLTRCMHNLSPVIPVLTLPTTNGWKVE